MAPSYQRLGAVPPERHVALRAPDGQLHHEEVGCPISRFPGPPRVTQA